MISVIATARKLSLGVLLIAAAAGVLLYSDLGSRNRAAAPAAAAGSTGTRRVAVVQHASQVVIEDGLRGVLEALAQRGYAVGGRLQLRRFNAEGDLPTAAAIAREVTSGGYDLVITLTTLSLQTVANANKTGGQVPHVFGLVSDPYGAGVGIDRQNHLNHPAYLTGYGSIQPVKAAFTLARQMRPDLKTVGIVWNPSESNSLAQTVIARAVCKELGITLVEVSAESSANVAEAAAALVSRGVEAIWISGDVTVLVAADAVIATAKRAKIPVFTVIPPTADKGALFDLGANYIEIGRATGSLAADVLDGRSPAGVPVENLVPEMLVINRLALDGLKDRWQIPDAVAEGAAVTIDATGRHTREVAAGPAPLPQTLRVDLIEYLFNLQAARRLGIQFAPDLLARADEIIR